MSYSIRYGPRLAQEDRGREILRFQWLTAAFALMMAAGVRLMWPEGREVLARWVSQGTLSGLETATRAMASAVAAGEGWYHGFTVFCRTILEAA